jgi:hypothetical protein
MARLTAAQKMAHMRERRRRGQALVKIKLDRSEVRKLAALGYLDRSLTAAERGPNRGVSTRMRLSRDPTARALHGNAGLRLIGCIATLEGRASAGPFAMPCGQSRRSAPIFLARLDGRCHATVSTLLCNSTNVAA